MGISSKLVKDQCCKDLIHLFFTDYLKYVIDVHQRHRLSYSKMPFHRHQTEIHKLSIFPSSYCDFKTIGLDSRAVLSNRNGR